jgi:membrane-bound serine protease (ClpP class)
VLTALGCLALVLLAGALSSARASLEDVAEERAVRLDLEGPIGPATSDYVARNLAKAQEADAPFVVLRIDTPGGLDTSMREIIRAILASSVPVICYVAPSGAHAASAGTFILYACHVAAMAPGTNLGAATPVQVGAPGMPQSPAPSPDDRDRPEGDGDGGGDGDGEQGAPAGAKPDIRDKAVSDAVAYIRSLAQLRGRNIEFAEKAVREAASLSADDALQQNVIDVIATSMDDLLERVDGREVTLPSGVRALETAGVPVVAVKADWRTELLAVITNPNVASILMLIGIYGLLLEFYSPGLVGPGVIGAICLLLALYAFHVLPIDYSGLGLMVLGLALMVAEAFVPSFGVLGLGGIAAFVIGSVMLIDADVPGFAVAWPLVGGVALTAGVLVLAIGLVVMRSRQRPVVSGTEEMIGSTGPVIRWRGSEGAVRVHGEIWRARCPLPLLPDTPIRVTAVDGLTLVVEPAPNEQGAS